MWYRFVFALITIFFVVMNVLLWRAEVSGRNNVGSRVPAEVVWKKILTAPDASPLELRHRGEKVGSFRWVPSIGEDTRRPSRPTGELPPEGMVKAFSRYDLELEGQLTFSQQRMGFRFEVALSTNYAWQDFSLRVTIRPQTWELRSYAAEKTLRITAIDGEERTEHVFTFDELRDPEKLLRKIAGPWVPPGALAGLVPFGMADPSSVANGIEWEARSDTIQLGTVRIRGYRLRASLLGRFEASLFVNTLGEVVRIELPDQIVIVNEGLISL
jgi:hypothetical protein